MSKWEWGGDGNNFCRMDGGGDRVGRGWFGMELNFTGIDGDKCLCTVMETLSCVRP